MKRIVILGGGYGGLFAARTLERALRRECAKGEVRLALVSRENFHVFHGFVAQMLTGTIGPTNILSPLRRLLRHTDLHVAEVEEIHPDQREVVISRELDGRRVCLGFDHLIVALGSEDRLDLVPGLPHHAMRLKSYSDCLAVRDHLLDMLELAAVEEDAAERRRLLTFVLAGGGYAGVEMAAELATFLTRAHRDWPRIQRRDARVVLIHSRPRLLSEMPERLEPLARYVQQRLIDRGVELKLETRLLAATPEEAVLSSGERVATRTIISTIGTATPRVLADLGAALGPDGRIRVGRDLSVPGLPGGWALGDCACVPHPRTGGPCPPTAIFAMRQGVTCAQNIVRTLSGQATRPFTFVGLGEAASLGGRDGIGTLGPLQFRGWLAWLLRRVIFLAYVPSRERMVRILLDWLLKTIFHRDIVLVRGARPPALTHEHYEPGQVVVRRGSVSRQVLVVLRGLLVVESDGSSPTVAAARLGPGDCFGAGPDAPPRADATVRCLETADILRIARSEYTHLAGALGRLLPLAGREGQHPGR